MFNIELSAYAKKFLRKCDKNLCIRILKKIKNLSNNPFPHDTKRIVGRQEKIFRIRVGNYRITYVIFTGKKIIVIADIDKRERIYKK